MANPDYFNVFFKGSLLLRFIKSKSILSAIVFFMLGVVLPRGESFSENADFEKKVVLQLAWKHQFQFAGYYAALSKGYYRDAGLDVELVEGGDGCFAREELLNKRAQYGVAGSELILHRFDGDPFVVLAPVFQHSPSILLTLADSGIIRISKRSNV